MLRSKNIVLRTFREADLEPFLLLESDLDVRGPYYPLHMASEALLRKQYHETGMWDDNYSALLICNPDNHIIGHISAYKTRSYSHAVEVGYILYDTGSRGKGIITEALTLFVEYLFASRAINRIELVTVVENAASRRVAEKCGFTLEGIMRSAAFHEGKYIDLTLYALLREEACE